MRFGKVPKFWGGFLEFRNPQISCVPLPQCVYKQFDTDRSGTIGPQELPGAFEAAGLGDLGGILGGFGVQEFGGGRWRAGGKEFGGWRRGILGGLG